MADLVKIEVGRMLQALHVHNFALIEDAKVEFTGGFNVLPVKPAQANPFL